MITIRVVTRSNLELFLNGFKDRGLILSALNLFMLGFLEEYPQFPRHAHFWCDGILGAFFMRVKGKPTSKFAGVFLLRKLISYHRGDNVSVFGSMTDSARSLLDAHSLAVIEHYALLEVTNHDLEKGNYEISTGIVFITLPSPKQEILALNLIEKYPHLKVYCIGGALNMLACPDLDCPAILRVLGFEFLFRLRTDTKRRLIRLFQSMLKALLNCKYLKSAQISID